MALAETIKRKLYQHGVIPKVIKALPYLSLICAVGSIIWLAILPMDGQYRRTYISENALMPGQAHTYFRESEWNIERGYRNEIHAYKGLPLQVRNSVVEEWLNDIGFKTSYHKYDDENQTLYGIMHAPRGDDTEAMVLAAPWMTAEGEFNEGGVAVSIALARYFSRLSIWSKNIIIVFPPESGKMLRSWVEAYHTSLDRTAGSIEAALVVEYPGTSDYFDYMELIYEGLNGQLPNLDLVNTAALVASYEGCKVVIQQTGADSLDRDDYITRAKILFKGIKNLAIAGMKTGAGCEAFSGWHIQALTLRARGTGGPFDITSFGRVVESSFRSVNNLLEKFHQSFFYYLMLTSRKFVSIGTYLPSAVVLAVSYALSALGLLLNGNIPFENVLSSTSSISIILTGIFSFSLGLSLVLIKLPQELTSAILISLTSIGAIFALLPLMVDSLKPIRIPRTVAYSLNAIALFVLGMLMTTLSAVNFALALSIGVFALPLTFTRPSKDFRSKVINTISLIVSFPFTSIYVLDLLGADGSAPELMRGLLSSWDDLQSWTWFIVMLGWFPSWLCIAIVDGFIEDVEEKEKEKTN